MIYVASPYSSPIKDSYRYMTVIEMAHKTKVLMENRYLAAMKYVAKNLKEGKNYFSPIVYTHEMAHGHCLPKDFKFWQEINHRYLEACSELHVLMLEGWEDSAGVKDEINYAITHGMGIKYIEWEG